MSTPEIVSKYLRLDRAIGNVMQFMGVRKADMNSNDQKSLDDALTELDAASTDLQKFIYVQAGII